MTLPSLLSYSLVMLTLSSTINHSNIKDYDMYQHHNPELAQPIIDRLIAALGEGWTDSSYGNDWTASVSYELPSGSVVSINVPNSETDEPMDEEIASFYVFNDDVMVDDTSDGYTEAEAIAKARELSRPMTQPEFWSLDYITTRQEIQKRNPYGSEAHRKADKEMKAKCSEIMGEAFANQYWGEY